MTDPGKYYKEPPLGAFHGQILSDILRLIKKKYKALDIADNSFHGLLKSGEQLRDQHYNSTLQDQSYHDRKKFIYRAIYLLRNKPLIDPFVQAMILFSRDSIKNILPKRRNNRIMATDPTYAANVSKHPRYRTQTFGHYTPQLAKQDYCHIIQPYLKKQMKKRISQNLKKNFASKRLNKVIDQPFNDSEPLLTPDERKIILDKEARSRKLSKRRKLGMSTTPVPKDIFIPKRTNKLTTTVTSVPIKSDISQSDDNTSITTTDLNICTSGVQQISIITQQPSSTILLNDTSNCEDISVNVTEVIKTPDTNLSTENNNSINNGNSENSNRTISSNTETMINTPINFEFLVSPPSNTLPPFSVINSNFSGFATLSYIHRKSSLQTKISNLIDNLDDPLISTDYNTDLSDAVTTSIIPDNVANDVNTSINIEVSTPNISTNFNRPISTTVEKAARKLYVTHVIDKKKTRSSGPKRKPKDKDVKTGKPAYGPRIQHCTSKTISKFLRPYRRLPNSATSAYYGVIDKYILNGLMDKQTLHFIPNQNLNGAAIERYFWRDIWSSWKNIMACTKYEIMTHFFGNAQTERLRDIPKFIFTKVVTFSIDIRKALFKNKTAIAFLSLRPGMANSDFLNHSFLLVIETTKDNRNEIRIFDPAIRTLSLRTIGNRIQLLQEKVGKVSNIYYNYGLQSVDTFDCLLRSIQLCANLLDGYEYHTDRFELVSPDLWKFNRKNKKYSNVYMPKSS